MTKSLSDIKYGFGIVGLMQYFIFHSRLNIERYYAIIFMFHAVNYFTDLSHINI